MEETINYMKELEVWSVYYNIRIEMKPLRRREICWLLTSLGDIYRFLHETSFLIINIVLHESQKYTNLFQTY